MPKKILIEFNGKIASLPEHSRDLGISVATIYYRMKKTGESALECLTHYWEYGLQSKSIELNGKRVSKKEYCIQLGYNYNTIIYYICHYNLSWEEAIKKYLSYRDRRKVKDWRFYSIWQGMVSRCTNPKNPSYPRYGGRVPNPVKVCNRWLDYFNFEDDMFESYQEHVKEFGEKDTSINRKNGGNYCIDDCEWATQEEQANDKSNNRIVYKGLTLAQFCKKYRLSYNTTRNRIELGWTIEEILNSPSDCRGGKFKYWLPCKIPLRKHCKVNNYNYGQVLYFINKYNLEPHEALAKYLRNKQNPQKKEISRVNLTILPTGETLTEFSKRTGISRKTLESRIRRGWSLEKIVNTPLQEKYSHRKANKN